MRKVCFTLAFCISVTACGQGMPQLEMYRGDERENINQKDSEGFTRIYKACFFDKTDEVKTLLAFYELDPNILCRGFNPLFYCVSKEKVKYLKWLLNHNRTDPNIPSEQGVPPLFFTCEKGLVDATKALLSHHGIDPNLKKRGSTHPLYIAQENQHERCFKAVLEHPRTDPNITFQGWTCLVKSIADGHRGYNPYFDALMKHQNIDPNLKVNGCTPLYSAAQKEAYRIIRQLLIHRATDPNLANDDGWTPLTMACDKGLSGVVNALTNAKWGVDLDKANGEGYTGLWLATFRGHSDCVRYILGRCPSFGTPAEINCSPDDSKDNTPLCVAFEKKNEKIAQILLSHRSSGACALAKTPCERHGITPLELCLFAKVSPGECSKWVFDGYDYETLRKQYLALQPNPFLDFLDSTAGQIVQEALFWYVFPEGKLLQLAARGIRFTKIGAQGGKVMIRVLDRALESRVVSALGGRNAVRAVKGSTSVVESIIKQFSKHGVNQAINRGFRTCDILKIVRQGKLIETMGRYGKQTKYTLGGNTVIISSTGKVISMFSNAANGFFIPF